MPPILRTDLGMSSDPQPWPFRRTRSTRAWARVYCAALDDEGAPNCRTPRHGEAEAETGRRDLLSCLRSSAGRRGLVQGARPVWALCVVSPVRSDVGECWVEEMGVFCEVISPRPTPPDPAGADSWSAESRGPGRWPPLLDTVEACEWSTPTKTVPCTCMLDVGELV